MANPYPADVADSGGNVRLSGAITFTDATNQPGGASALTRRTVVLDDAALLALDTTPVELVAAVADSLILPSFIICQFNGTPYVEGGALRFYVGASYNASDWTKFISHYAVADGLISPVDFAQDIANAGWSTAASIGGHFAVTAAGALTGGPGALTVDTWYLVVPLSA